MEQTRGYYNTFIVRIWCDEPHGATRGQIKHVSSQEYRYFLELGSMTEFIKAHLKPPDAIEDGTLSVVRHEDAGRKA